MSEERCNVLKSDASLNKGGHPSMASDTAESNESSGSRDQILKILESSDPSHLIDESYKKFKSNLEKLCHENQMEFQSALPKFPEQEKSPVVDKTDVLYRDAFRTFLAYVIVILMSLLAFQARWIIEYSKSLPSEEILEMTKTVLESMKDFVPYLYGLVFIYLAKDKLISCLQ